MNLWTLEFELSTQDTQGNREYSLWDINFNNDVTSSTYIGRATSPVPSRNDILSSDYDNPGLWQLNQFELPDFDPTLNNEIAMGYVGGGDFGHIKRLRVYNTSGDVFYGEYPLGYAYGIESYEASATRSGLNILYGYENNASGSADWWLAGDGDFPPFQWNMRVLDYDTFPVDSHGVSSGVAHFFFTVPDDSSGWTVGAIRGS